MTMNWVKDVQRCFDFDQRVFYTQHARVEMRNEVFGLITVEGEHNEVCNLS